VNYVDKPQSQVLITEAGSSKKMDKSSKTERNTSGSSKENEIKSSPESHIELDSRLLSALLTVSINNFYV
jgi:ribosome biogenesis protein MAK21